MFDFISAQFLYLYLFIMLIDFSDSDFSFYGFIDFVNCRN